MFAKRFFQKVISPRGPIPPQGCLTAAELDPRVIVHYGIPSTASVLALDPVQSLLAVGTLDGRIKVIGGHNIEGILVSPKQSPFKNLEFIQNQGFLVSVSNENEIQVWNLENRQTASSLQWESNITAFSVIRGTSYMYVGDEYGMVSVLKYDAEEGKLVLLPYYVPTNVLAEAAGISSTINHPVVGVLPQPYSQGNRLLIAFMNGLIILWDALDDHVVSVRGNRELVLKGKTVADSCGGTRDGLSDNMVDHDLLAKEISCLCWASNDGSVLAVGYVDGDILFWDLSTATSTKDPQTGRPFNNDVVKLQLSSAERRLPVIGMHWHADRSCNDWRGQLFVYGGDEIGSKEVLAMLSLDWSSGLENLKCVSRADLTLNGSFADMVLSPVVGSMKSLMLLFVLTNPGQLHVYDDAFLSAMMSWQDKEASISPVQYPVVIPTTEPYMTAAKLASVYSNRNLSRTLYEIVSAAKLGAPNTPLARSSKWALTGGAPSQLFGKDHQVERLYIAGYQDGSVRIWDATYPAFSLMSLINVLESEVNNINIAGASAPVSVFDLCSLTLSLAVGNECGMVRLYQLIGNMGEMSLNIVTDTDKQVHTLHQGEGPQCTAVFSLLNSPVCALQFTDSGARLAVGFKCGRVAMLDISASSVLFLTDNLSVSSSPISSLSVKSFSDNSGSTNSHANVSESESTDVSQNLAVFVMTRDAHLVVLDGSNGNSLTSRLANHKDFIAISMYIIGGDTSISEVHSEKHLLNSSPNCKGGDELAESNAHLGNIQPEGEPEASMKTEFFGQTLSSLLVLLCCEDALRLISLKSLIQGDIHFIQEVNLSKPCCWTTTFKKDEKECGLVVIYRTGVIEIRSLPYLEVVGESSLMSVLKWNFKTSMDNTMCSSDRGHVAVINGCEFAVLSVMAHENDFRIPESLTCLHDKALAADATMSLSPIQKKTQDIAPGVLGGIIKGLRKESSEQNVDHLEVSKDKSTHLESIFSYPPFLKPSTAAKDEKVVIELDIDDINVDEIIPISSSSRINQNNKKDKDKEKEKLFEGATTDTKPRMRTAEEIKAKYRKAGDTSAVASQARDKLMERKEKLERLSQHTAELQSGAENFASMATELVQQMERRKWWQI